MMEENGGNTHPDLLPLHSRTRTTVFPCQQFPPRESPSTETDDEEFPSGQVPSSPDERLTGAEIINNSTAADPAVDGKNVAEERLEMDDSARRPRLRKAVSIHGTVGCVTNCTAVLGERAASERPVSCRYLGSASGQRRPSEETFSAGERTDVCSDDERFAVGVNVRSDFMDGSGKNGTLREQPPEGKTDLTNDSSSCRCSAGCRGRSHNSTTTPSCCSSVVEFDVTDSMKLRDSLKECRNSELVLSSSDTTDNAKERASPATPTNEIVVTLAQEGQGCSRFAKDASSNLRVRSIRKSPGGRKKSDGSKSASPSPSPVGSPVLQRLNTSGSGTDDTASNGDEGSGEDDEDDGVYDETFRYSSYKYIGDEDAVEGCDPSSDDKTLNQRGLEKQQDGRVGSSCSESVLYNCSEKKNHQRSLSMTTSEMKRNGDGTSKTLSRKVILRHVSMGAETYQAHSERVFEVERTLLLQKPDSVTSYGFHLLGQNPMVISTVEPGSAADFGGVQVGDRLVMVNGTNVVKAKQSTVVDLVVQTRGPLELGVASGLLSRDICICSGYLNLKSEGLIKNWKRRWCQLKYDGFLYYYKSEDCVNPLGAISLSNYVIIRGTDCGRGCVFKLVKYGQKTYYIQAETDEEMNRWASNINMATSMANMLCDTWLDISSHNVRLPALSIKNPDCHGFLAKIGYHKKTWRKRYCVLKSACLYYYKDQTSSTAKGVAHLHGYTIQDEAMYRRRFGFMVVPPVSQMRTFHFSADNETDMQRWISALRSSIGKWVKVED